MNRKIQLTLSLALLIALISVSGCLRGVVSDDGDRVGYYGVQFTALYPVATEIHEGGTLSIYSSVQNNGYADATDVNLNIYNCGDFNGIDFTCNTPIDLTDELEKPDRELGVVGEVEEYEFSLRAPSEFPEGRSPHTFTARITYDYQSTATRDVVLTTFDNWREKGGELGTGPLNFYSEPAPISVEINAPETPVIISNGAQKFTVAVSIRNVGGGYVKNKELTEIELCYDKDFVSVSDADDFAAPSEEEDSETPYYYCCEHEGEVGWQNGRCEFSTEGIDEYRSPNTCTDAGFEPCNELCEDEGYESGGGLTAASNWQYASCKCKGERVPSKEPGCIYVTDTNKLGLIGLQNQWRDVSVQFETLDNPTLVQDIIGFDATVKYTYSIDQNTQVTLVG